MHRPVEREGIRDAVEFANGNDGRVAGAEGGGVAGHVAADCEDEHRVGLELIGQHDGALDELLTRAGEVRALVEVRAAAALDAARDAIKHFDAFQRILPDGRLAAEHDRVRLLEHGVRDVGDLGARGQWVLDHAFEHVRGDNDGASDVETRLDDAALDDGQLFVGTFDSEIAACHHDAVGLIQNFVEVTDGELVLNLGDEQRLVRCAGHDLAQLLDVLRLAHEGERDEVHADIEADLDIREILRGEGRQADPHSGKIDVTPAAQRAGCEDFALDLVLVLRQHLHVDLAVVDQHGVTNADVADEVLIIHVHGVQLFAFLAAHGERELLSRLEIQCGGQVACADGGPLRVHENADRFLAGRCGGANVFRHPAHPIVRRVGHIKPGDVHAGVDELAEHLG